MSERCTKPGCENERAKGQRWCRECAKDYARARRTVNAVNAQAVNANTVNAAPVNATARRTCLGCAERDAEIKRLKEALAELAGNALPGGGSQEARRAG